MRCHFVKFLLTRLLAALMPLLFAGLTQAQTPIPEPVPVDKVTDKILLEVDINTLNFRVVYPYKARPCLLCSEELAKEFGPGCERALSQGRNICLGLVDATVNDLAQIMLIRSRKNPRCITIAHTIVGGTDVVTQLCQCLTTDPPGACPGGAAMWIQ